MPSHRGVIHRIPGDAFLQADKMGACIGFDRPGNSTGFRQRGDSSFHFIRKSGSVGKFTDGSAFPDEMETAIAALAEPGAISGAVETDAGTHFIRLEERIAGDSVDYTSVRGQLRASIEASIEARSCPRTEV